MIAGTTGEHIPYFNAPHLAALALVPLVPAVLAWWAKRADSEAFTRRLVWALVGVLLANEIAYRGFHFTTAENSAEFINKSLPIHICPLALFAGMFALSRRSQVAYEIAYFWGFAGTINALFTPDIEWAFPSFGFIGYFTTHCGVLWMVLFATWSLNLRPTWRSVWRAYGLLLALGVILTFINLALGGRPGLEEGANYAFLCAPPAADTPFIIGPWPWYLVGLAAVALGLFVLAYLPFWWMDRKATSAPE